VPPSSSWRSVPTPTRALRGTTLFALETGVQGFDLARKLDKVGQPEADTAELFFDQVRVPTGRGWTRG